MSGAPDSVEAAYEMALECLVDECTHDDVADCVAAIERLRDAASQDMQDRAAQVAAAVGVDGDGPGPAWLPIGRVETAEMIEKRIRALRVAP